MKPSWKISWVITLSILLISNILKVVSAQALQGWVYHFGTKEPVSGATVYLHELRKTTETDAAGKFSFAGISHGKYTLHVSILGYKTAHKQIEHSPSADEFVIYLKSLGEHHTDDVVIEDDFLGHGALEDALSVTTADKTYLEQHYSHTLVNTIELIPGVQSFNTGIGIAKPVIRGMMGNRVRVNDYGIAQEGQQWGTDHGLEVDQFNVEQLEVIKGPMALQYGSDASTGTVNLLPPRIPKAGTFSIENLSLFRSNNNLFGNTTALKYGGKHQFFRLRYTHQEFGDYRVPATQFIYNTYVLPIVDQRLKNTAGKEQNFSGEWGLRKKWGLIRVMASSFNQQAGFFPGAFGIPRSYQLYSDSNTRDIGLPSQKIGHYKLFTNTKLFIHQFNMLEIEAGIQQNVRTEYSRPHSHGVGPVPEGNTALQLDLVTAQFNAKYTHCHAEKLTTKSGINMTYQQNRREGYEFLIPQYDKWNTGLFTTLQYSLSDSSTLSGGLRFDYASFSSLAHQVPVYQDENTIAYFDERVPDINRRFFNFSAALGYSAYLAPQWIAKANLARTFRYPNAAELAANGIHHGTFRHEQGNPGLAPETGYQLDLTVNHEQQNYRLQLTPFLGYFDRFIYLRPTAQFSPLPDAGQVYAYTQHNVLYTGGELLAEYHPWEIIHLDATIEYVFNYNLETYLPLPFTPPLRIRSAATVQSLSVGRKVKLTAGLETEWAAAQARVDRNEAATPAYFLLNVRGGIVFHGKNIRPELMLRMQNLLDTYYLKHLSRYRILNLPEQGRNIMISLKIPLNIKRNE